MTRIKVKKLIWDKWNIEHIKKHNLTVNEAEEAVVNFAVHKHGYANRYVLIGRSGKRIISVIVSRKAMGEYYVVTARDADKKERKIVYDKEKPNSKI